ncbi:MAG: hypothetical protein Fur0035_08790 [Anaerolineales bacterium]
MKIERVSAASEDVYAAIARLLPQLTNSGAPAWSREFFQRLVNFPGSILLIAREADGKIVGAATLSLVLAPTGEHARLEDVVVDEAARGRGIGAALTRAAIRLAGESGASYLALTSNPRREAANRLYQRLGFTRWETNVYRKEIGGA